MATSGSQDGHIKVSAKRGKTPSWGGLPPVWVHADGRATFGHSLVVDPWGEVVLDMGEAPGIGYATIDPARVDEVRARVPALRHRRAIPAPKLIG